MNFISLIYAFINMVKYKQYYLFIVLGLIIYIIQIVMMICIKTPELIIAISFLEKTEYILYIIFFLRFALDEGDKTNG